MDIQKMILSSIIQRLKNIYLNFLRHALDFLKNKGYYLFRGDRHINHIKIFQPLSLM